MLLVDGSLLVLISISFFNQVYVCVSTTNDNHKVSEGDDNEEYMSFPLFSTASLDLDIGIKLTYTVQHNVKMVVNLSIRNSEAIYKHKTMPTKKHHMQAQEPQHVNKNIKNEYESSNLLK
jgi:hypothetical protein